MHGYISDLHWVMPQCTYLLYTIFIPYLESHNWVNVKNLTSCEFPNVVIPNAICGEHVARQEDKLIHNIA